jgi:hypothetical protein
MGLPVGESLLMNKIIYIVMIFAFLSGCENETLPKPPEMELEAKNTVLAYLAKNKLPVEYLKPFVSSAQPSPDFSYLYTGGGRCIEFIINCHGKICTELRKYPYDEHGEQCP